MSIISHPFIIGDVTMDEKFTKDLKELGTLLAEKEPKPEPEKEPEVTPHGAEIIEVVQDPSSWVNGLSLFCKLPAKEKMATLIRLSSAEVQELGDLCQQAASKKATIEDYLSLLEESGLSVDDLLATRADNATPVRATAKLPKPKAQKKAKAGKGKARRTRRQIPKEVHAAVRRMAREDMKPAEIRRQIQSLFGLSLSGSTIYSHQIAVREEREQNG